MHWQRLFDLNSAQICKHIQSSAGRTKPGSTELRCNAAAASSAEGRLSFCCEQSARQYLDQEKTETRQFEAFCVWINTRRLSGVYESPGSPPAGQLDSTCCLIKLAPGLRSKGRYWTGCAACSA